MTTKAMNKVLIKARSPMLLHGLLLGLLEQRDIRVLSSVSELRSGSDGYYKVLIEKGNESSDMIWTVDRGHIEKEAAKETPTID